MKKLYSTILLIGILLFSGASDVFAAVQKKINANIKTKRIPAETVITLRVLDSINSSVNNVGDQLNLMVVENIKVGNSVVIPEGSMVRGAIETVEVPQRMYKGGVVRLYFDHIVSSTGKQVPFYAGICNNPNIRYDGALSSNTTYKTAFDKTVKTSKDIIVKPTQWAWEKGDVEKMKGVPKYIFAPITAIVATPVAGIYFIGDSIANTLKKGKDININQGETLTVQLLKPIDMPVY